jgi:hypothetical protein
MLGLIVGLKRSTHAKSARAGCQTSLSSGIFTGIAASRPGAKSRPVSCTATSPVALAKVLRCGGAWIAMQREAKQSDATAAATAAEDHR